MYIDERESISGDLGSFPDKVFYESVDESLVEKSIFVLVLSNINFDHKAIGWQTDIKNMALIKSWSKHNKHYFAFQTLNEGTYTLKAFVDKSTVFLGRVTVKGHAIHKSKPVFESC